MKFVGRQRELEVLDEMWTAPQGRFLVLYGRRRIGKTRLLTHWLTDRRPRSIYWVARPASSSALLLSFSQALFREGRGKEPDPAFTYPSWEMAWQEVAELSRDEPLALLLDEITYNFDATLPAVEEHVQIPSHFSQVIQQRRRRSIEGSENEPFVAVQLRYRN